MNSARFHIFIALTFGAALACARTDLPENYSKITPIGGVTPFGAESWTATPTPIPPSETPSPLPTDAPPTFTQTPWIIPTATPRQPIDTSSLPTPDAPHVDLINRNSIESYTVQRGDSLSRIGEHYGVSAKEIAQANTMTITDTLHIGQVLLIPLPRDKPYGPDVKLIPDSEFVYGPGAAGFDTRAFVEAQSGYLAGYVEDVSNIYMDGSTGTTTLTGSEIVQLVARRYSVNPRLLLALLEYQSGWVTRSNPGANTLVYPLGRVEVGREDLYRQLSWAANQLNYGYYIWRVNGVKAWGFEDNSIKLIPPGLNSGTTGIQHFFSLLLEPDDWTRTVSAEGFSLTYQALFGNPFALAIEPLVPAEIAQPELHLPFEPGKVWAFTGGPHGAWDTGSAWAALDFAPPIGAEGCLESDEWVTAAADGLIVRSEYGAVLQDLDGDGYETTGWVLFYMHIESRDRVQAGARVAVGDRIGHPSCEGGFANGTHVHFARKYNGEWIPADQSIPIVLDGWVSVGLGKEYDGNLVNGDVSLEACDCRSEENEISRP
jgi:LasA protease